MRPVTLSNYQHINGFSSNSSSIQRRIVWWIYTHFHLQVIPRRILVRRCSKLPRNVCNCLPIDPPSWPRKPEHLPQCCRHHISCNLCNSGYPTLSVWSLVPLWQRPVRVRNSPGSRCHSDSQPMSYKNLGFSPPLLLWHHYPQEAKRIAPPVICQAPHCCAPITSFPLTPTKATLHVQANSFLCGAICKRNINPALYAAVGSHMSPGDVHTTVHAIGCCLFL